MRLELDAMSKRHGSATALDSVSLSADGGEFFTLVGPSGCGKTTTLRCIAGFESLTEGTVRFDGESMVDVAPESRGVGVVFQNYALFPHFSVGENVTYGLRFTDLPGGGSRDGRVAKLLDLVDLAGFEDHDPGSLSGGQQQRVALARTLAPGPDLLLLDKPMSALNIRPGDRLRRQVKCIQSDLGVTTVYVTYDQSEALVTSDRVAVLNGGRVGQVGDPRDLYHRPRTRFVAEFLGENNVLDGVVESRPETGGIRISVGGVVFTLAEGPWALGEAGSRAGAGDELIFCVRPEQLRVSAGTNKTRGAAVGTEFQGATTRVRLDRGGTELVVAVEGGGGQSDAGFEVGTTLEIGFAPASAHVVE